MAPKTGNKRALDTGKEEQRGGKRTRKPDSSEGEDEVESMPKPYVCPIYRQEIASFLPRAKIEEWRLLSRLSNRALAEFRYLLPRRLYSRLKIFTYNGECTRKPDGFVSGVMYVNKAFESVYKFRFCCKGLKGMADSLVGKLIFPGRPEDEVVVFMLHTPTEARNDKEAALRVVNRMTLKTANSLLHFLRHIKDCRFEALHFEFATPVVSEEQGKFHPQVLKVLTGVGDVRRKFMLYADKMMSLDYTTLKIASQIVNYRSVSWRLVVGELQRTFDFLSTGRAVARDAQITVGHGWGFTTEFIDRLVRHFTVTVRDLRETVPSVTFTCKSQMILQGWPRACPKTRAFSVVDGCYNFRYRNSNSGEKFELSLRSGSNFDQLLHGWDSVSRVRLKFN